MCRGLVKGECGGRVWRASVEGKCGGSIMGGEIRTSSAVARQVVETVTCSIMPRLPSRLGFGPWARGSRTF